MARHDVMVWKEDGVWTAHSPALVGVYGTGITKRKALDDYVAAANLMLSYMDELGEAPPKRMPIDVVEVEI